MTKERDLPLLTEVQPEDYMKLPDDNPLKELLFRQGPILLSEWSVGFKDRGMGRGDFAVICTEEHFENPVVVVECPTQEIAAYLVRLHNANLAHEYVKTIP